MLGCVTLAIMKEVLGYTHLTSLLDPHKDLWPRDIGKISAKSHPKTG